MSWVVLGSSVVASAGTQITQTAGVSFHTAWRDLSKGAEQWRAMKRILFSFAVGAAALSLMVAPAGADLIDILKGNSYVIGTVGYVQQNHFMLVGKDNQMIRVFLKPGFVMPPGIMPGQTVTAYIKRADNSNDFIYLDRVEAIQQPNGTFAPAVVAPGNQ